MRITSKESQSGCCKLRHSRAVLVNMALIVAGNWRKKNVKLYKTDAEVNAFQRPCGFRFSFLLIGSFLFFSLFVFDVSLEMRLKSWANVTWLLIRKLASSYDFLELLEHQRIIKQRKYVSSVHDSLGSGRRSLLVTSSSDEGKPRR